MVSSRAPGKVLFAGEFAGTFELPLVMTSLGLYTTTVYVPNNGPTLTITTSFSPTTRLEVRISELIENWEFAWATYQRFLHTDDWGLLRNNRVGLNPLLLTIGAGFSVAPTSHSGGSVDVVSELPIGSGLGSSASMCASVLGALLSVEAPASRDLVNEWAYKVERVLNGRPSGGDNAGVVYGDWQVYGVNKVSTPLHVVATTGFWLIDGGTPSENSMELIAHVAQIAREDVGRQLVIKQRYKQHVENFINNVHAGTFPYASLIEEQEINEALGIVGPRGRNIVARVREFGGVARMCGAGGVKNGAGAILACFPNATRDEVRVWLVENQLDGKCVQLGVPGWSAVHE